MPGMVRSRSTRSGWSRRAAESASYPSAASPTTSKPCWARRAASASRVSGWASPTRMRTAMDPLSAAARLPTRGKVQHARTQSYRSWLLGELLLVGLLASATALFAVRDTLTSAYALPEARLAFDTAVALVALIVAVLASVRFVVEGRVLDLLLAAGFWGISLRPAPLGLVPLPPRRPVRPATAPPPP